MVEKVPSLKGGGLSWFTDLTTPDPYYILPVLTGLSFLATVEVCNFSSVIVVSVYVYHCACNLAYHCFFLVFLVL
jgi:hypothetical protein